jgi:hypothetical protein
MHYVQYEEKIIQKYSIELVGWTPGQWKNPNDLGNSLPPLKELYDALVDDKCKFIKLTVEQSKNHRETYEQKIASGQVVVKARRQRSDKGKPRKRKASEMMAPKHHAEVSDSSDEDSDDESEEEDGASASRSSRKRAKVGKAVIKSTSIVPSDADDD